MIAGPETTDPQRLEQALAAGFGSRDEHILWKKKEKWKKKRTKWKKEQELHLNLIKDLLSLGDYVLLPYYLL